MCEGTIAEVYEVIHTHLLKQGFDETTAQRAAVEESVMVMERAIARARLMEKHD